jgi:hypothetical protein
MLASRPSIPPTSTLRRWSFIAVEIHSVTMAVGPSSANNASQSQAASTDSFMALQPGRVTNTTTDLLFQ